MNTYIKDLIYTVIDHSESSNWEDAVYEWDVVDCYEDNSLSSSCICGKEDIKYCYTIFNNITQKELYPIGSQCIRKFKRQDLNDFITINEKLFSLLHALRKKEYITLTSQYFSRKLLLYLYEEGTFIPNRYNDNNPQKDYDFLLKMFNQRTDPTEKQQSKINALMVNNIKPYLERLIGDKIATEINQ